MTNIFTDFPKAGDAVVGILGTNILKCITQESFSQADLDTSTYEVQGAVVEYRNGEVLFIAKDFANKIFAPKAIMRLGGYVLDGTDRQGTLYFRVNSSDSSNTAFVVNYNTTTKEGLVEAINTVLSSNETLVSQGYLAYIDGDDVKIIWNNTFWQQYSYNSASNGFTLTRALFDGVPYTSNIRRKHGGYSSDGAISSMSRAVKYFRNDNASTTYNPNTDVTTIKQRYPICLQGYLGTSAYQSDHCAFLRGVYGEGEDGWLKFMASCEAVVDDDLGAMGVLDGYTQTKKLLETKDNNGEVICKAAEYCDSYSTNCLSSGSFYLGLNKDIKLLLDNIDIIDETLAKMGKTKITDNRYLWCCLLFSSVSAWIAYGGSGYFDSSYLYGSCACVPFSRFHLNS